LRDGQKSAIIARVTVWKSRSLLKKSLFKNDFLRKRDTATAKWPFLHAGSQNIAVFWPIVGRQCRAIFRVGGFSKHS